MTPKEDKFDKDEFTKWLNKVGYKYIKINAYTLAGQKEIVKLHCFKINKSFWDKPLEDTYWELILKVHDKGFLGGWGASPIEGYHRTAGSVVRSLASKLDIHEGILQAKTITEEDFFNVGVGTTKAGRSDTELHETIFKSTFYSTKQSRPIVAKFIYFIKPQINAGEGAYHCRSVSRGISNAKRSSVHRCVFEQCGRILGKSIRQMDINQATRRIDFNKKNPTYKSEPRGTSMKNLALHADSIDLAYPSSPIYEDEVYKSFVAQPFDTELHNPVKQLLSFPVLKESYHCPDDSEAFKEIDSLTAPEAIEPPFYPGFKSLAIDVGKDFDTNSNFNPDSANNAYFGPMIMTLLFMGHRSMTLEQALEDENREKMIWYWLRFHNNTNHSPSNRNTHGVWNAGYKQEWNETLCEVSTCIVGCTQLIMSMYNAVLSCGAETTLQEKWEKRQARLNLIAKDFETTFSLIGTCAAGRDGKSVIQILGE